MLLRPGPRSDTPARLCRDCSTRRSRGGAARADRCRPRPHFQQCWCPPASGAQIAERENWGAPPHVLRQRLPELRLRAGHRDQERAPSIPLSVTAPRQERPSARCQEPPVLQPRPPDLLHRGESSKCFYISLAKPAIFKLQEAEQD